jgi:hypothetical protein
MTAAAASSAPSPSSGEDAAAPGSSSGIEATANILAAAAAEAADPGADTADARECPFCVMMRKGGCEAAFKVRVCVYTVHAGVGLRREATGEGGGWASLWQQNAAVNSAASWWLGVVQHQCCNQHTPAQPIAPPEQSQMFQCMHARTHTNKQAFMECGEKADKGEADMAQCLPQVCVDGE